MRFFEGICISYFFWRLFTFTPYNLFIYLFILHFLLLTMKKHAGYFLCLKVFKEINSVQSHSLILLLKEAEPFELRSCVVKCKLGWDFSGGWNEIELIRDHLLVFPSKCTALCPLGGGKAHKKLAVNRHKSTTPKKKKKKTKKRQRPQQRQKSARCESVLSRDWLPLEPLSLQLWTSDGRWFSSWSLRVFSRLPRCSTSSPTRTDSAECSTESEVWAAAGWVGHKNSLPGSKPGQTRHTVLFAITWWKRVVGSVLSGDVSPAGQLPGAVQEPDTGLPLQGNSPINQRVNNPPLFKLATHCYLSLLSPLVVFVPAELWSVSANPEGGDRRRRSEHRSVSSSCD